MNLPQIWYIIIVVILMEIFLVEMILIKNENDPREMFVYFLVVIVITRVKLS